MYNTLRYVILYSFQISIKYKNKVRRAVVGRILRYTKVVTVLPLIFVIELCLVLLDITNKLYIFYGTLQPKSIPAKRRRRTGMKTQQSILFKKKYLGILFRGTIEETVDISSRQNDNILAGTFPHSISIPIFCF